MASSPLIGTADGDSGSPQLAAPGTPPKSPVVETAPLTSKPVPVTLPTIPNYKFQFSEPSKQEVTAVSSPGKRLKNPLGEFNTYTYQLSLYAVTPDAYAAFVASGRKKIDVFNSVSQGKEGGGAWIVAQSGGINNENSKRAPGFNYDYSIDNLKISAYVAPASNGGTANIGNYDYSFQIIEPYGFSFINNLKKVTDVIKEYSKSIGPENPTRQFFILGIRFFGYGVAGVPAKPSDAMTTVNPEDFAMAIDPTSQTGNLFEYYLDISINSVKFTLDGNETVYTIEAKNVGEQGGFSMKRGLINYPTTITAGNVAQAIEELMVKLNTIQKQRKDGGRIGATNNYKVVWGPGTQQIIDAKLISPADLQKFKWPGSGAVTQQQVNAALETRTQGASNTGINIAWKDQTPILTAINQIITQSSFLEDALKIVYTTALESPEGQNGPAQVSNPQQTKISWYSCTAEVEKMVWDNNVKDWAYNITYYIQRYETPVVDSAYVKSGLNYPGPHKRYEFWYTGKNTEIIKYVQVLDNLWFNNVLAADQGKANMDGGNNPSGSDQQNNTSAGQGNASKGGGEVPSQSGLQSDQSRQGRPGQGTEAHNNYLTSIYDPKNLAEATIDILGDPDYLFEKPTYTENTIYNAIYGGNGFTINPNGGQVFIEIDFKEAVDYDNQTGTLSINDSIQFWKYPNTTPKRIKGIPYLLSKVDSQFSRGSFTQRLTGQIKSFSDLSTPVAADAARPATPSQNTTPLGTPPNASGQSASTPGFRTDTAINAGQAILTTDNTNNQTPAAGTTPTGKNGSLVRNDDAGR
jgi:hypothetical protein